MISIYKTDGEFGMERKYFKYNSDDILEVLIETLAVESGFGTFSSRSNLIVENGEIFFVGVIGELGDEEVHNIDLEKLYSEIEYNGTHPAGAGYSSADLLNALEKSLEKGHF